MQTHRRCANETKFTHVPHTTGSVTFPWRQSRKGLMTDAPPNLIGGDTPSPLHSAISPPRRPSHAAANNPASQESTHEAKDLAVRSCVLGFHEASDLRWKHVRCQANLCQVSECRWKDNSSKEEEEKSKTASEIKAWGKMRRGPLTVLLLMPDWLTATVSASSY